MGSPASDEIDDLVSWQLHGGEDAARWRRINHPLEEFGDCLCPACKAVSPPAPPSPWTEYMLTLLRTRR